jgi:hypothetical protein
MANGGGGRVEWCKRVNVEGGIQDETVFTAIIRTKHRQRVLLCSMLLQYRLVVEESNKAILSCGKMLHHGEKAKRKARRA